MPAVVTFSESVRDSLGYRLDLERSLHIIGAMLEPHSPPTPRGLDIPTHFERLLDEMIDFPEQRVALTERIHREYEHKKAVLFLDMCGFSRTTQQFGIVAFLVMIRRMRRICDPCFCEHGGEFVKADADNLLYLFETAADAIAASREAHHRIASANQLLPGPEHLFCAIGIGCGQILCIAEGHVHGNEVNLAAKLGEDIAAHGQILLTKAARTEAPAELATREACASVSGLELVYYELLR